MQLVVPPRRRLVEKDPARRPHYSLTLDRTLAINDKHYLVQCSSSDSPYDQIDPVELVTLIDSPPSHQITRQWLKRVLRSCAQDDVFSQEFLEGIAFWGVEESLMTITTDAREYLVEFGTEWICFLAPSHDHHHSDWLSRPRPGPYVCIDNALRNVCLLVEDVCETFQVAIHPDTQRQLRVILSGYGYIDLAIPSRLRFSDPPPADKPLLGWRIAVKDNIHLRGLKTTNSSRAYIDTFGPQSHTAPSMQILVDRGAVMIGKTKLTSFAVWEEAMESIDFEPCTNPRADQCQSAGGSSSGSAAAIAAYDWLDIAIGTDTDGSIARPAMWNGVFGLRPSHGAVSNLGMLNTLVRHDTPGFFARDLTICATFASAWYGDKLAKIKDRTTKSFDRIYWLSDFWDTMSPGACRMARQFVTDMEDYLNISCQHISFVEDWSDNPPAAANNQSLHEYVDQALLDISVEGLHHTAGFRERYRDLYQRAPFVSPPVKAFWDELAQVTPEKEAEAVRRIDVFRSWLEQRYMPSTGTSPDPADRTSVSGSKPSPCMPRGNAMFILPIENMAPRYRDRPITTVRKPPPGLNMLCLASLLGAPQLSLPIGEIDFHSRISDRDEKLVYGIGAIGTRGSDLELMDTVYQCMKAAGRPTSVGTGRFAFEQKSTVKTGLEGADEMERLPDPRTGSLSGSGESEISLLRRSSVATTDSVLDGVTGAQIELRDVKELAHR